MTLDEPTSWSAAAALERGENPEREKTAQFKLATLLAEHDDLHSVHHQMLVAGRVLAFLPRIQGWADAEQQSKPRGQLRQQQVATLSDEDEALERAHYHLAGYREAMGSLRAMGSVYAKDYVADDRGVREDERREREARQDEAGAQNAPRVAAS